MIDKEKVLRMASVANNGFNMNNKAYENNY